MMYKAFRFTLVTLVLGFFLIGLLLQTGTVREYTKNLVIRTIKKETGYDVDIAEIRLYPSFQCSLKDVTLSLEGKKILSVGHFFSGVYPIPLLEGYFHSHTMRIEKLEVFTAKDTQTKTPSFLLSQIPVKIHISQLIIEQAGIYDQETETLLGSQVNLRGSLYIDPKEDLLYSALKIQPVAGPNNWIQTELAYENRQGSLQITTEDNIDLYAEFALEDNNLIAITRFHSTYAAYTADGHLSITTDGRFKESFFTFKTGELSEQLPLEGNIHGEGNILGSLWAPELDIKVYSDSIHFADTTFFNIKGTILSRHTKEGLKGELSLSFVKDSTPYQFTSSIFWDENLGPIPTRVRAEMSLSELAELIAIEATDLKGDVALELQVREKDIVGTAILSHGHFESYALGSQVTNIYAVLEGNTQKIKLVEFRGEDEQAGRIEAQGVLDLDSSKAFPYQVQVSLENVELLNLDNAGATATGELILKGDIQQASLEGALRTNAVKLNIPEKSSEVAESLQVTYINQPKGEILPTPSKIQRPDIPLELNITIDVAENAVIKGKDFKTRWKGEAVVTGTPIKPLVNGEFNIVEGTYKLRGRNLNINEGTINFSGDPEKKATLYVIMEMDIDKYKIEIILKGPLKNPAITLRSNPPLAQREILSWILFNRPARDISQFQGTQLSQSITSLSTGTDDGPDFLTRIYGTLGIDRVEISGDPTGGAGDMSVEVGKYLTDRTYISYKRDLSTENSDTAETHRIHLDTNLGKHFKLQAEVDDDQNGQINLIWRRDY